MTDQQVPLWLRWGSGSLATVLLVGGAFLESRDRLDTHPFLTNLLSGATGFLFTTFVVSVVINRLMANDRQRRWSAVSILITRELHRGIAAAAARLCLDYGLPTASDGLAALREAENRLTGLINRADRLAEALRDSSHDDSGQLPGALPEQIAEFGRHLDAYPTESERDSSVLLRTIVDELIPEMLSLVANEIAMTRASIELRWAQRQWQTTVERHQMVDYSVVHPGGKIVGPETLGVALKQTLDHYERNPTVDLVAAYRAELDAARKVLGRLADVDGELERGEARSRL